MEITIKIDENIFTRLFDNEIETSEEDRKAIDAAIRNGIPLPKGHGRLIDGDKVADRLEALRNGWNYFGNEYESGMYKGYDYSLDEVMDAPTVIETDK